MKPGKHGRDHRRGGEDPTDPFHAWCVVGTTSAQSVAASGNTILQWGFFYTNAPDVFRTGPTGNTAGDTMVLTNEYGVYLAHAVVSWEDLGATVYSHQAQIITANFADLTTTDLGPNPMSHVPVALGDWPFSGQPFTTAAISFGYREGFDYAQTTATQWSVMASNYHSSSVNATNGRLFIIQLSNTYSEANYHIF